MPCNFGMNDQRCVWKNSHNWVNNIHSWKWFDLFSSVWVCTCLSLIRSWGGFEFYCCHGYLQGFKFVWNDCCYLDSRCQRFFSVSLVLSHLSSVPAYLFHRSGTFHIAASLPAVDCHCSYLVLCLLWGPEWGFLLPRSSFSLNQFLYT